jgi:YegS/Rv2252/BmrU family lipid kinase
MTLGRIIAMSDNRRQRNRRFALLVNPYGGTRRGLAVLQQVRPRFQDADAHIEVFISSSPGHLTELARTLDLSPFDAFCLIGGDGTIHDVINGMLQRPPHTRIPLGIIPAGTGNSVLLHMGCTSWRQAVDRILAGQPRAIDVARVTWPGHTTWCLNMVGWGSVVDINQTAERWRWLGGARYSLSALAHIPRPRRRRAKLTLDGSAIDDDFLFIVGCMTKFIGKNMCLAPRASLEDGKIDVVVVRKASRMRLLALFRKIFDGSHVDLPDVEYHQVRSLRIETKSADPLNLDGELKGFSPVQVEVVPAAIEVLS